MFVHFKTEVETVRVYISGDESSYDNRDDFDTVALIKYTGGEAEVSAAHGELNMKVCREIYKHCIANGAKTVRWEHKHKESVKT